MDPKPSTPCPGSDREGSDVAQGGGCRQKSSLERLEDVDVAGARRLAHLLLWPWLHLSQAPQTDAHTPAFSLCQTSSMQALQKKSEQGPFTCLLLALCRACPGSGVLDGGEGVPRGLPSDPAVHAHLLTWGARSAQQPHSHPTSTWRAAQTETLHCCFCRSGMKPEPTRFSMLILGQSTCPSVF